MEGSLYEIKLYSPLIRNSFDEEFKELVEKKIKEYSIKSFEADTDDPLQNSFTMGEVVEVCRSLPNGKASGLDVIQYEHFNVQVCRRGLLETSYKDIKFYKGT